MLPVTCVTGLGLSQGQRSSGTKKSKPAMEKRRRARINASLAELRALIPEDIKRDNQRYNKLEKADVLEMTVQYLRLLQTTQKDQGQVSSTSYNLGFNECTKEVSEFFRTSSPLSSGIKRHLLDHLHDCAPHNPPDSPSSSPSKLSGSTSFMSDSFSPREHSSPDLQGEGHTSRPRTATTPITVSSTTSDVRNLNEMNKDSLGSHDDSQRSEKDGNSSQDSSLSQNSDKNDACDTENEFNVKLNGNVPVVANNASGGLSTSTVNNVKRHLLSSFENVANNNVSKISNSNMINSLFSTESTNPANIVNNGAGDTVSLLQNINASNVDDKAAIVKTSASICQQLLTGQLTLTQIATNTSQTSVGSVLTLQKQQQLAQNVKNVQYNANAAPATHDGNNNACISDYRSSGATFSHSMSRTSTLQNISPNTLNGIADNQHPAPTVTEKDNKPKPSTEPDSSSSDESPKQFQNSHQDHQISNVVGKVLQMSSQSVQNTNISIDSPKTSAPGTENNNIAIVNDVKSLVPENSFVQKTSSYLIPIYVNTSWGEGEIPAFHQAFIVQTPSCGAETEQVLQESCSIGNIDKDIPNNACEGSTKETQPPNQISSVSESNQPLTSSEKTMDVDQSDNGSLIISEESMDTSETPQQIFAAEKCQVSCTSPSDEEMSQTQESPDRSQEMKVFIQSRRISSNDTNTVVNNGRSSTPKRQSCGMSVPCLPREDTGSSKMENVDKNSVPWLNRMPTAFPTTKPTTGKTNLSPSQRSQRTDLLSQAIMASFKPIAPKIDLQNKNNVNNPLSLPLSDARNETIKIPTKRQNVSPKTLSPRNIRKRSLTFSQNATGLKVANQSKCDFFSNGDDILTTALKCKGSVESARILARKRSESLHAVKKGNYKQSNVPSQNSVFSKATVDLSMQTNNEMANQNLLASDHHSETAKKTEIEGCGQNTADTKKNSNVCSNEVVEINNLHLTVNKTSFRQRPNTDEQEHRCDANRKSAFSSVTPLFSDTNECVQKALKNSFNNNTGKQSNTPSTIQVRPSPNPTISSSQHPWTNQDNIRAEVVQNVPQATFSAQNLFDSEAYEKHTDCNNQPLDLTTKPVKQDKTSHNPNEILSDDTCNPIVKRVTSEAYYPVTLDLVSRSRSSSLSSTMSTLTLKGATVVDDEDVWRPW